VQTRVGNLETGLVDRLVAVEQQVEVDRARTVAGTVTAYAAEAALDLKEQCQQLSRRAR
jgi:hypothetical protein